jgi:hypothetical protein
MSKEEKLMLCLSCGIASYGDYCYHCNNKKVGGVDV